MTPISILQYNLKEGFLKNIFFSYFTFLALFNLNALFKLNPINTAFGCTFLKETLVKNP